MLNKPQQLGNVETMFILAVTTETLATMLEKKSVANVVGKGEQFFVTTRQIANRVGYPKLTTYHHRILNQLAEQGWLEVRWEGHRMKYYSMGYQAWRLVGFNDIANMAKNRFDARLETPIDVLVSNIGDKE